MRLLQLNPNGSEDHVLDLHPMTTVVTGVSAAGRDLLLRVVRSLPAGADPACAGLVESHGIFFDLGPDVLDLLELGSDVDVVVGSGDVDAVIEAGPSGGPTIALRLDETVTPERFLEITPDGVHPQLDAARKGQRDAREALSILREAADRVRVELDDVAARRRRAEAALDAARAGGDGPRLRLVGGDDDHAEERASLEAQLDELEAVIDRATRGIAELRALDVRPIQVLIDAIRNPEPVELVASDRGAELAGEFERLRDAVDALENSVQVGGITFTQAMARLDEARAELRSAERAMQKPELSDGDVTELEAAHEEVLEAERKASGGLGKRAAAKRLEEAREAEQVILDRVGYPTWSSYIMGASLFTVDPLAQERLNRAKIDLEAAESVWAEISTEMQTRPEHRDLLEQLEAVYLEAIDLLGGDTDEDLANALRNLRVANREVTVDELVDALAYQLELVGMPLGPTPVLDRTVLIAEAFLAEAQGVQARIAELEAERASNEAEVARLEHELAHLGETTIDLTELDEETAASAEIVEQDLTPLEEALAAAAEEEQDYRDLLEAREALLDTAIRLESAATGRLRKAAGELAAAEAARRADDPLAAFEGLDKLAGSIGVSTDEEDAVREAVQVYLLARLAALRSVSFAGSTPIVLDDALRGLDDDDVAPVLDRLDRMSDAVQVIYLGDDERVVRWAERVGFGRAAVVPAPSSF
jgi:hypothetical protein